MQTQNAPVIAGDTSLFNSTTSSAPRRRGRPRVHANDSEKKAAYRARRRTRLIASGELRLNGRKHLKNCDRRYCLCDLPMSKGAYLTDSPTGVGQLVSGGFSPKKVEFIRARREADSRRVTPEGWSSDKDEESTKEISETDDTFTNKQKWVVPQDFKADAVTTVVITAPTCWCGSPASTIRQSRLLCDKHAPVPVAA